VVLTVKKGTFVSPSLFEQFDYFLPGLNPNIYIDVTAYVTIQFLSIHELSGDNKKCIDHSGYGQSYFSFFSVSSQITGLLVVAISQV